ncbi:MAG TPA: DNA polymerase III subunit epsilon [Steroidobacteraceae bacterium]|nr:DNA polymerase III subunit epsilon [Steroidobacteraceae bacterium]
MRQVILDTETTGLEALQGHRIIEVGCVELINRRASGRTFHRYLNPERDIDPGAQKVHGLSRERLAGEPRFAEIARDLLEFITGAELVMHNAQFDVGFLDAELARLPGDTPVRIATVCTVLDTYALARELHPGQRNNLDALCKRYKVDNSKRDLHGALLDARILADVYLAMTGGQSTLELGETPRARRAGAAGADPLPAVARPEQALVVREASAEELAAHEVLLALLDRSSRGQCVWRKG